MVLGTVVSSRSRHFQVTYAGHPLYFFDPGRLVHRPALLRERAAAAAVGGCVPSLTQRAACVGRRHSRTGDARDYRRRAAPPTTYTSPVVGVQEYPAGAARSPTGGITVSVYAFSSDSRGRVGVSGHAH